MRAYSGRIFAADEHLNRLEGSCRGLSRRLPGTRESALRWIEAALGESGHRDAMLRFSVHWDNDGETRYLVSVRPFASYPEAYYRDGVRLRSTPIRRPSAKAQSAELKTSQYVSGVLAWLEQRPVGPACYEFIFLGPDQTVSEGSVSNLFIVKHRCLLTPPAASGILRGVTRSLVMELGRRRGLSVVETPLTRHELYNADECLVTNTSSEVMPVVEIDGRLVGEGRPGPVAGTLRKDLQTHVREYCRRKAK